MSKEPELFVVVDAESGALEYGPAPDKDAALAHKDKLVAYDTRGQLADTVGRTLKAFKLVEVK